MIDGDNLNKLPTVGRRGDKKVRNHRRCPLCRIILPESISGATKNYDRQHTGIDRMNLACLSRKNNIPTIIIVCHPCILLLLLLSSYQFVVGVPIHWPLQKFIEDDKTQEFRYVSKG